MKSVLNVKYIGSRKCIEVINCFGKEEQENVFDMRIIFKARILLPWSIKRGYNHTFWPQSRFRYYNNILCFISISRPF